MRPVMRLVQIPANGRLKPESADRFDKDEMLRDLAGYVLEQPAFSPPVMIRVWAYLAVMTGPFGEPEMGMSRPTAPLSTETRVTRLQLRPVGQLVPLKVSRPRSEAPPIVGFLRPVQSGQCYRITSRLARGLVTPELAEALEAVFESFSRGRGSTPEKPLQIRLSRGFKAGSPGHGKGRAADIAAVGGESLLEWRQAWDRAMAAAEALSDPEQQAKATAAEQQRNLGYGLYKALQEHGGWRVNPKGWRPYRGVMQLFGPWTATHGPWKAMQIKEPNPYQRQRLADQQWVFQAHRDHIHVAR